MERPLFKLKKSFVHRFKTSLSVRQKRTGLSFIKYVLSNFQADVLRIVATWWEMKALKN